MNKSAYKRPLLLFESTPSSQASYQEHPLLWSDTPPHESPLRAKRPGNHLWTEIPSKNLQPLNKENFLSLDALPLQTGNGKALLFPLRSPRVEFYTLLLRAKNYTKLQSFLQESISSPTDGDEPRLMLLRGKQGTGKTTLAHAIIACLKARTILLPQTFLRELSCIECFHLFEEYLLLAAHAAPRLVFLLDDASEQDIQVLRDLLQHLAFQKHFQSAIMIITTSTPISLQHHRPDREIRLMPPTAKERVVFLKRAFSDPSLREILESIPARFPVSWLQLQWVCHLFTESLQSFVRPVPSFVLAQELEFSFRKALGQCGPDRIH